MGKHRLVSYLVGRNVGIGILFDEVLKKMCIFAF